MVVINRSLKPISASEGSSFKENELNPDLACAKSLFESDIQEGFSSKISQLLFDDDVTTDFKIPPNGAVKTSDGAYYTNETSSWSTVSHTWDDTKAINPKYYIGVKLRWFISYFPTRNTGYYSGSVINSRVVYIVYDNVDIKLEAYSKRLVTFDFINNSIVSLTSGIRNLVSLERVPNVPYREGWLGGTSFSSWWKGDSALKFVEITFPTNTINDFDYCFEGCYLLRNAPITDVADATTLASMYKQCYSIREISLKNTSGISGFGALAQDCLSLKELELDDTSNGQNFTSICSGCTSLETVKTINLIKATYMTSMFNSCSKLKNLTLLNIKKSLQIGSGTSYGHLLTDESIINTFKELHDLTGTTSQTLTLSTPSNARTEAIYVKLIEATEDMIANDPYITSKKPCVVCESTDDGAMTLKEYGISKNWNIA